jgi:hypothetical protein
MGRRNTFGGFVSSRPRVTEEQAECILLASGVSLKKRSVLKNFTAQLEATVETICAIHCVAGHYHKVAGALRDLRQAVHEAKRHRADHEANLHWAARETKNALMDMKASSRLPEMAAYRSLLKVNAFQDLLKATDAIALCVDDLAPALSRVPTAFSGRPIAGSEPRLFWYPGFVRDLAEIAKTVGVPVTTAGDREGNQHKTAFTNFVFAAEKLLPPETQCKFLPACARRIDRAIENSRRTLSKQIPRKQKPQVKRRTIKNFVV